MHLKRGRCSLEVTCVHGGRETRGSNLGLATQFLDQKKGKSILFRSPSTKVIQTLKSTRVTTVKGGPQRQSKKGKSNVNHFTVNKKYEIAMQ